MGGGHKNQGFTLIELLAVIIIIGVIALIVSPIILNVVGKSKRAAFERSIDGIIEAVRIDLSDDDFLTPREYFYEGSELSLLTVNDKKRDEIVKISGRINGNGFIYVDGDGNIIINNICNKEYCANGKEEEIEISKNPTGEVPDLNKEDPVISLNGDSTIYVELNGVYKELGAIARTKAGDVLEYTTEIHKNNEVVTSIDTSVEGTYIIIYRTSNNEKTVSVEREVAILNMVPVITMTESNETYEQGKEVLITVSGVRPNKVTGFSYEIKKDGESIEKESVLGLTKTLTLNETGIYEVMISVTDNKNHTNTLSKTYKIDKEGPVIVFEPETVNLESEEVSGYDLFTGVTVTDNVDGVIENSKIKTSGTLEKIPGIYKVTYTVSDSLGNTSSKERTFVVTDTTKPEITISPNEESSFVKSKIVTITATDNIKVNSIKYVVIKDNVRGEEQTISTGEKVTLNEGTGNYEIEVTAVDSSNNSKTVTSGIYKIDQTKPTINVPENTVLKITEVTSYNLSTGITVSDNSGIGPTVETTGSLTATLGEQTVTYKAIDQAGNEESVVRKFTVVEAEGPILNFSNAGSNVWTKAQTIKATATDNSNLKTFTYEVIKNNVSKGVSNVSVSGKSAEVDIPLNESGTYVIKLNGSDEYGNPSTLTSGEYKIDVDEPVVGSVTPSGTMGSNGWYTSNVTFSITNGSDTLSGHKSTTVSPTSLTGNTTGTSVTVTTTDNAGNMKSKTFGPYKIDKTKPEFTVKSTGSTTINKGASNAIQSTYFNSPTWSISGTGSIVCKNGSTTVTNTSSLAVGTHTITCTATGQNGLITSATKTIIIKAPVADTTGANKPTLSNGLIPIKWNGSSWIKADTNNLSDENQWYDYSKQMWANAASVTSGYRNVSVGTVIPESAINAYFVWIPRYEYQYTSLGTSYAGGNQTTPGEIKINFVAKSKTSPSTNYKIHPAFTFGGTELSGIWVGKFETSASPGSICYTTPNESNCNNINQTPYIKPNVNSIIYQTVSNQFATAQKFSASGNSYGISTSADAHMMKNSEWGAVAYLSQSKYGKYGNSSYTGTNKEVYINNNREYQTGCSGGSPNAEISSSCTNAYNVSPGGTGASTSGTIYGVYDMNGGSWEYVMGVYNQFIGKSGFSSMPTEKYYDNYTNSRVATACNSGVCYGHALSETSGWYSDYDSFINSTTPWLLRGRSCSDTIYAGVFSFESNYGGIASNRISFRVVLLD